MCLWQPRSQNALSAGLQVKVDPRPSRDRNPCQGRTTKQLKEPSARYSRPPCHLYWIIHQEGTSFRFFFNQSTSFTYIGNSHILPQNGNTSIAYMEVPQKVTTKQHNANNSFSPVTLWLPRDESLGGTLSLLKRKQPSEARLPVRLLSLLPVWGWMHTRLASPPGLWGHRVLLSRPLSGRRSSTPWKTPSFSAHRVPHLSFLPTAPDNPGIR